MDATPTPTLTLTDTLCSTLIISFILIENKCLSDAIWDLKRDNFFGKRRVRTRVKKHAL